MEINEIKDLIKKDVIEKGDGISTAKSNTELLYAYSHGFRHDFFFRLDGVYYIICFSFDYDNNIYSELESFLSLEEMKKYAGETFWHTHQLSSLDGAEGISGDNGDYFVNPEFYNFVNSEIYLYDK